MRVKDFRTHRKNVFWPHIFVGAAFQILDIQPYACGLRPTRSIRSDGESRNAGKLGPAARVPAKPLGEDPTPETIDTELFKELNGI
jgi:hypothetical protein